MSLNQLRSQIDNLDLRILTLLNERAAKTLEIAKLKSKLGKELYAPDREYRIYERLFKHNPGPIANESIEAIYREVMSGSFRLAKRLRIAYLGPQDSFTHLAALKKFGSSVDYVGCSSITEIFSEVEKSRSGYGVVPIENSIEGAVNHTLDMFVDSELVICSEILLRISHNLVGTCPIGKIKRIYSNPQVFGQCRQYLEAKMPKAEKIEVYSTSKAAEIASKKPLSSAIASSLAATHYGLKVLAESIEDASYNITRFLVLSRVYPEPTNCDKTSIMFSIHDKVGALHNMLVPFKKYRINLTKIESRPSRRKAWEYYFFIDMEGHCQDKRVKHALSELGRKCTHLKILGSYPAAKE